MDNILKAILQIDIENKHDLTQWKNDHLEYKCPWPSCTSSFPKPNHLDRHVKIHNNHLIKCHFCQFKACQYVTFQDHIDVHLKVYKYKCCSCEKSFGRTGDLRLHYDTSHQDVKQFCAICKAVFKNKQTLQKHLRKIHQIDRNYSAYMRIYDLQ